MKIVKKDKKMISNKTMRELGIEIDDNLSEFNKNINSYQKYRYKFSFKIR